MLPPFHWGVILARPPSPERGTGMGIYGRIPRCAGADVPEGSEGGGAGRGFDEHPTPPGHGVGDRYGSPPPAEAPSGIPLCCVPPNAAAEAEHLAYRVGRAIDRLARPLRLGLGL